MQKSKDVITDSLVGDENPYGAFVSESSRKIKTHIELDVVTHRFEKGLLVTVIQGESRIFSEFFPYEEHDLDDPDEEEEDRRLDNI